MAPGDPAYAWPARWPPARPRVSAPTWALIGLLFVQYLLYLKGLLRLDLGTSYSFQAPALDVVLGRLPYTITLAVAAIVLTTVIAIPLGTWMARHAAPAASWLR